MYDDMAQDGLFCKDEAEFRSYDILLNLSDSNVHRLLLFFFLLFFINNFYLFLF